MAVGVFYVCEVLGTFVKYTLFFRDSEDLVETIASHYQSAVAETFVYSWFKLVAGTLVAQTLIALALLLAALLFIAVSAMYLDLSGSVYATLSNKLGIASVLTSAVHRTLDQKVRRSLRFHLSFALLVPMLVALYAHQSFHLSLDALLRILAALVVLHTIGSNVIWMKGLKFDKRKSKAFVKAVAYHSAKKTLNYLVVVFIIIYAYVPFSFLIWETCRNVYESYSEVRISDILSQLTSDNLNLQLIERRDETGNLVLHYRTNPGRAVSCQNGVTERSAKLGRMITSHFQLLNADKYRSILPTLTSVMPVVILVNLFFWFAYPFILYKKLELGLDLIRKVLSVGMAFVFQVVLRDVFLWDVSFVTRLSLFLVVFVFTEYFLKEVFARKQRRSSRLARPPSQEKSNTSEAP